MVGWWDGVKRHKSNRITTKIKKNEHGSQFLFFKNKAIELYILWTKRGWGLWKATSQSDLIINC